MKNQLIIPQEKTAEISTPTPLEIVGQIANKQAKTAVFAEYLLTRSDNTIVTQAAALATFANYLAHVGIDAVDADCLQHEPKCWRGVTWGIVAGFVKWQLGKGFAIATVNNRLSTVKTYCKLATKAGVIDPVELQLIKAVSGYSGKAAKLVDERREVKRVGNKKAAHVSLETNDAKMLTDWAVYGATPQGRRDLLLMCLLLEHGLRVGEVAALVVTDFKLKAGELTFYRQKVDKVQTHRLTGKTYQAAVNYFEHDAPAIGRVLLGSTKGGKLTSKPMSERAITKRVAYLGFELAMIYKEKRTERGGGYIQVEHVPSLSAHDCRHYWATDAARNGTDLFTLQEAGGWSSLDMPRRYVEAAKIANEGVKLTS